jgi:hypothetical protein
MYTKLTFVTVEPARKKTASNAKKALQGCMTCIMAVANAVRMPTDVNDFLEYARYTRAAIAGIATIGFMMVVQDVLRHSLEVLEWSRVALPAKLLNGRKRRQSNAIHLTTSRACL